MQQEKSRLATRQNYDRLSRWYDSFYASERLFTKAGLRLLDAQPGEKILEIGFGTGHALIELARAAGGTGSVCGIDLSPGMFAIARRRIQRTGMEGRISLQLGDATRLPFSDHQFNAVFMSFTLELFETAKIPVLLVECQRVLQPGGRLGIVSLVKKNTLAVEIYEWFHIRFPKVVDCHPIFVRQVLEAAGFTTCRAVEKRFWGLPVAAVVAKKP
jgi:demethylmenaquinone methyltransferase/2-methoxy-6-polyprenyl-1,4-benzoquinol methylase